MGLFDISARLDKRVAEQYPGTWELLELSSENAHGQQVSHEYASTIARISEELAGFPILVGVQTPTRVSTDGVMWTALVRIAWPRGSSIESVMDVVRGRSFALGKLSVAQRNGSYSDVLKSCKMNKVWRCNYKKQAKSSGSDSHPSKTLTVEQYGRQIDGLIASLETADSQDKRDKCKMAQMQFVQSLGARWRNGDMNALLALEQLIRREVNTHNMGKGQWQQLALREMASTPQLSIDPLLSMLRDDDGNPRFSKEDFAYWGHEIISVLEDIALANIETERLVREFVSIGTMAHKMGVVGSTNNTGGALGNIRGTVYQNDDKRLLSGLSLSPDEKDFLATRGWKFDRDESCEEADKVEELERAGNVEELVRLFRDSNLSDSNALKGLVKFVQEPSVQQELVRIFSEGAVRLDDKDKLLAVVALGKVDAPALRNSTVTYPCNAIASSSNTTRCSVEIRVGDLLALKELEYANGIRSIPLKRGSDHQWGTWFEVTDSRIVGLCIAKGTGIWNSTTQEVSIIPESLGELTELSELDLRGQRVEAIPQSVKELKKLRLHVGSR